MGLTFVFIRSSFHLEPYHGGFRKIPGPPKNAKRRSLSDSTAVDGVVEQGRNRETPVPFRSALANRPFEPGQLDAYDGVCRLSHKRVHEQFINSTNQLGNSIYTGDASDDLATRESAKTLNERQFHSNLFTA
jgi:hypothetical protein